MPVTPYGKTAWNKARRSALIICLAVAGCSWESGLDLLARTAANTGEAWCRHADNCYPACDAELEKGHPRPDRIDGQPGSHCAEY